MPKETPQTSHTQVQPDEKLLTSASSSNTSYDATQPNTSNDNVTRVSLATGSETSDRNSGATSSASSASSPVILQNGKSDYRQDHGSATEDETYESPSIAGVWASGGFYEEFFQTEEERVKAVRERAERRKANREKKQ